MHRMPPRITQKSCRPRVSDRTMVGPRKPTRLLAQLPEPKASNDHGVMKPSSSNRQPLGLSDIRGEPTASPELRWTGCKSQHPSPLGEKGGEFFLDIPSVRTGRPVVTNPAIQKLTNLIQRSSQATRQMKNLPLPPKFSFLPSRHLAVDYALSSTTGC